MQEFVLKCPCSFVVFTTDKREELKGIFEYPNNCANCGKIPKYRCPKCGRQIKLLPIKR